MMHDIVGIGFGPGNLALAIALEETRSPLSAFFLEANETTAWQRDMMIVDADIQHSPFLDLVTPRNPQSRYSFLSYLHDKDKMFEFFNLGLHFPLREEYAAYIDWAAGFFSSQVRYGTRAEAISIGEEAGEPCYEVRASSGETLQARALVLATGRTPNVPDSFADIRTPRLIHAASYLSGIGALETAPASLAVIGGSQSAVEILLDATERFPGARIVNYIRNFGYHQKDLSPQMEASIFPSNVRRHYDRSWEQRRRFNEDIKFQNYSSADTDVLIELNKRNYIDKLRGGDGVYALRNNHDILECTFDAGQEAFEIESREIYTGERLRDRFDAVVLATGFRDMGPGPTQEPIPPLLAPLSDSFAFDEEGVLSVSFGYQAEAAAPGVPPVFLNGLCEGTHGVSDAGSFSLLALRAQRLLDGLTDRLGGARP